MFTLESSPFIKFDQKKSPFIKYCWKTWYRLNYVAGIVMVFRYVKGDGSITSDKGVDSTSWGSAVQT